MSHNLNSAVSIYLNKIQTAEVTIYNSFYQTVAIDKVDNYRHNLNA